MQTSSRVLPAQVALYKDSSVVSRNTSHCTTLWQAPYAFTPRKFAGSRLRKATLTLQIQTPTQVSKKDSSQSQLAKNEWSEHQCVMIDASLASTTATGHRPADLQKSSASSGDRKDKAAPTARRGERHGRYT